MGYDVLVSSMKLIQKEYLTLLEKYVHFDANEVYSIQNECCIFWLRHKREINFFLNNYPCDFDTCAFIGGMYLNVSKNQAFPFFSFGKKHIADDPVVMLASAGPQEHLAGYLKKAIEDNIDIIKNFSDEIFVLPLSFLFVDKEMNFKSADKTFWHLFSDSTISKETYLEKFSSLEAVFDAIVEDAGRHLFLKYDKPTLKERYLQHLECLGIYLCDGKEGVKQFYNMCIGLFAQSTLVAEFCIHYWTFPFIRDESLFGCFCLFLVNLIKQSTEYSEELKKILNKAVMHNLFYRILEFKKLDNLNEYLKMLQNTNFERKVLEAMRKQNVDCSMVGSFAKTYAILKNEMNSRGMPCAGLN